MLALSNGAYVSGLNRFVHEGMNGISNIKVHLKTRSGNVNNRKMTINGKIVPLQHNSHITLLIPTDPKHIIIKELHCNPPLKQ